jgi:two-component system phosphate regulon sensor histidine kinase PhoR
MRGQMQSQLGALERQRRRLDELIRNLTEGVIVCDTQGRVVLLNPTAARMLNLRGAGPGSNGAQAAELCRRMVGKPVEHCVSQRELQQLLAPDDRPAASADGGRREGAPWVEERRVTIPTQRGDVALLARVSDIELSEHDRSPGARSSRLMVLTDITTLQRTIQMKTDFVANASHELRTPLSAIRAAVETLSQMPLSDEPDGARRFLTMIDRHCGRLEELLRDLLDLSRVESTADAFETTRVHLPGLLEELRTRFAAMLESKGIELRIDCAPPARSLRVSARLLALTVGNLLENAIKFSEPGGQVRILSRRLPAAVSVAVEDDGCGIPADEHDRIFERFYQVKQTRATSGDGAPALRGSGLGLSIVKHAVVAMKGELQLDSAPGRGTRVSFTIPQ